MLLDKKCAIITGSNRGIGKAILKKFAENGCDVIAHARKKTEEFEQCCHKISSENHIQVTPVYFDFNDSSGMKAAVQNILKTTKKVDILINNVGIVNNVKLFQMTSLQEMRDEFEINFFKQIEFTQYISRIMCRRKNGNIVNISSCAGLDGNTGMISYVSGKAALIGATKRLAIELGDYNIRVNAVAPGLTNTQMGNQMNQELENEMLQHLIIKRRAEPEEIADVVLFLASDMSSFITGQVLRVDGGMLK